MENPPDEPGTGETTESETRADPRDVLDAIADGVFRVDGEWRFTAVNDAFVTMVGRSRAELLGAHVTVAFGKTDVAAIRVTREELSDGETETFVVDVHGPEEPTCCELRLRGCGTDATPGAVGSLRKLHGTTEHRERERALQDERDLLDSVLETSPTAISVASRSGEILRANERAVELFGVSDEESPGHDPDQPVVRDEDGRLVEPADRPFARVVETGEPVFDWRCAVESADRTTTWLSINAAPLRDGEGVDAVVLVGEDVTGLLEHQRTLERQREHLAGELDEVLERIDDAVFALDDEWRLTYMNEYAETVLERTEDGLLGRNLFEEFPAIADSTFQAEYERALESGESTSFTEYFEPFDAWFEVSAYPSSSGLSIYFRDVTGRIERERELQTRVRQQEAVTDLGQLALVERDLDVLMDESTRRVASVLDADYCKVLELLPGRSELLLRAGVGWDDGVVGATTVGTGADSQAGHTIRTAEPIVVDDLATETRFDGPDLLVDHDVTSGVSTVVGSPPNPWGVFGVHTTDHRTFSERDVNFVQSVATILATAIERRSRERELERYETIVETVDDGIYALDGDGRYVLVNDEYVSMTGYSREELLGRHASIVHGQSVGQSIDRQIAEIVAGEREMGVAEFGLETVDGTRIPTETRFSPYVVEDGRVGRTGVVRDVTERVERERELERQREQLVALNRLNESVLEIAHGLVESTTREAVERLVCEHLAASSYELAWIGDVDRNSQELVPRAAAGADDYLEEATFSIDDGANGGPGGPALETGTMQVVRGNERDDGVDPWLEGAREHGFGSVAAIPIGYENALYGVLALYTARRDAFDDHERTSIEQLGGIVGHAINAIERKEALMNDDLVELELEIRAFHEHTGGSPLPGRISIDRTVTVDDDTYLEYGTVTEDGVDGLRALVEQFPHFESLDVFDDRFGEARFELRLSQPPVVAIIADNGGQISAATIEDDRYHMVVELPVSADVRAIVDAVQREYADLELTARRRTTRRGGRPQHVRSVVGERLTDRQQTALETAYYSGFFEWPRNRTGEEIADLLGISSPTLHQHLRKAERKVLSSLFDENNP